MTKTFSPPRGFSLGTGSRIFNPGSTFEGDSGAEKNRQRHVRDLRAYDLIWDAASEDVSHYLEDFFGSMGGRDEAFFWTPPEKVRSPLSGGPTVTSFASGALSQQTYDLSYTWFAGSLETKPSPLTTFLKPANHFLRVTVPAWPLTGIDGWRLYDSRVPLGRVVEVTAGNVWDQTGALSGGGASEPTANTLVVPGKWRKSSEIGKTPLGACKYRVTVSIREVTQ